MTLRDRRGSGAALTRLAALALAALAGMSAAPACGDSGSGSLESTSGSRGAADPCDGTLASVQAEVFAAGCTGSGCHGADEPAANLDLSSSDLERRVVGAAAGTCDGWELVVPGRPERSLLWLKLYSESPPCGEPMPIGAHLRASQLSCVRQWIRDLPPVSTRDASAGDASGGGGGDCVTCGEPSCVDRTTDTRHCGDCNVACAPGSACVSGECTCDGTLEACGGACVDLQSSADHCGRCENACATGALCNVGDCVCAAGLEDCDGACVDPESNPANCGVCGNACANGQVCLRGSCADGCGSLTECNGACLDTQSSPFACGGCSNQCATGASCVGGNCVCPAGTEACGGVCRDVLFDPTNCGRCGVSCGSGQVCDAGACVCPGGGTACADRCADLASDGANCGACGTACAAGQTCAAGKCTCAGGARSLSRDVQPILTQNCAVRGCHGSVAPKEGLQLTLGASYSHLVNVASSQCSSRLLVAPGDTGASYLVDKLLGQRLCGGSQMPKAGQGLPPAEFDAITAWICNGAPND